MSYRTLILEVLNTICPLVLIWAVLTDRSDLVLPITIVLLLLQSVGLWSYLRDYYAR
jgi:hypothetical protein